ncbi:MAG: family 78 glycoside hydrolase catalytic domain, partial [Armatimonadetes bacterium]|nr:family 78 glycoside hydrolase catalytic domain [Armatimonadota bacterium]
GILCFGLDGDTPLQVRNPLGDDAGTPLAVYVGAGGEGAQELIASALAAKKPAQLRKATGDLKPLPAEDFSDRSVGCMTQWASHLDETPVVENAQAMCAANRDMTTIHPAEGGDVEVMLDFGREVVGRLEFEIEAPKGAVLDFYGFEAFHDGRPQWTQIDNNLRYITRDGHQFFHSVVHRGLRYLIITARDFDEPIRVRMVRVLFSSCPTPALGAFHCSDELLNAIWRMCAHTMRCCMDDTFVDCPLYEQALWVGDARNEALISYSCFGAYEFVKRNWRLAARSMFRSPVVESRVPSGSEGIIPAWALLWVLGCEETYLHDGDLEFVREIYPYVAECLRNFMAARNDQGLMFMEAWNFIDWAPVDTPPDAIVAHQNMWLVAALRAGARMAQLVGDVDDIADFERAAAELADAVNEHLFSYDQQAYFDCIRADGSPSPVFSQQTNTIAYLCGVVPEQQLPRITRLIVDVPDEWVKVGTPFTVFFVFEALARMGRHDVMLDWTRRYWGRMLDEGATTAWEMFENTRSHCHAWSAGPAYFLQSYQLGVRPVKPGFEHAVIEPHPVDLTWCEGRMPTPHGEIQVRWELSDERFAAEVSLPDGVTADLIMPVGSSEQFGWPETEGEGVMSVAGQEGRWVIHLDRGASVRVQTTRVS